MRYCVHERSYSHALTSLASPFYSQLCCLYLSTGMDGDVVARNIREFEKTHADVDVSQLGVWIVG